MERQSQTLTTQRHVIVRSVSPVESSSTSCIHGTRSAFASGKINRFTPVKQNNPQAAVEGLSCDEDTSAFLNNNLKANLFIEFVSSQLYDHYALWHLIKSLI